MKGRNSPWKMFWDAYLDNQPALATRKIPTIRAPRRCSIFYNFSLRWEVWTWNLNTPTLSSGEKKTLQKKSLACKMLTKIHTWLVETYLSKIVTVSSMGRRRVVLTKTITFLLCKAWRTSVRLNSARAHFSAVSSPFRIWLRKVRSVSSCQDWWVL